ncbi:MAG TPA: rhodanese-like domain-containing protein [Lacipirellulaceae bacterium]|nr:rhodanese-like domain-containing protein [Lacipirellulaceae bacterium]
MTTPDTPIEISCQDVAQLRAAGADFLLLDCREPDEAEICRIEGARLMPMSVIAARVGELAGHEKGRIVVHCHKGGRSYRAATFLRQQGFLHAQSMAGGIEGWADEIDPGMPKY